MRKSLSSLRLVQPFAAYSLTQQSLIFSEFTFHRFQPVALLMFAGGFIAYNYNRARFFSRAGSAVSFVFILLFMNPDIDLIFLLTVLVLLSWLYLQRTVKVGTIRFSVRKVPLLKTILLTLIWTLATAVIPLADQVPASELFNETAARFLFLFPVIIASDRIDIEKDKSAGVLSLPVIAGEKKSIGITSVFLLLYLMFLEFVYLPSGNHQHGFIPEALLLVSVIITGSMCLTTLKNKNRQRILLDLSVSSLFVLLMAFYACSQ